MQKFSDKQEKALMRQVKTAQGYINSGLSPDEAVVKVAEEDKVHPNTLPIIVSALNTGRQTLQREKCAGQGALALVEDFPVARVENIYAQLYPNKKQSQVKESQHSTCVSPDYFCAPTGFSKKVPRGEQSALNKKASTKTSQIRPLLSQDYYALRRNIKRAMQDAKTEARVLCAEKAYSVKQAMAELLGYFRSPSAMEPKEAFAYAKHASYRFPFFLAISDLEGFVEANAKVSRSKFASHAIVPMDISKEPYTLIKEALEASQGYAEAVAYEKKVKSACIEYSQQLSFQKEDASPVLCNFRPGTSTARDITKSSAGPGLLTPVLNGASFGFFNNLSAKNRSAQTDKKLDDSFNSVSHVDELRAIKAKVMLADLLQNDEVISGFDPDEVTSAYNDLAQLAPSASTQIAIMRPLLRRRLSSGSLETFDADSMLSMDKKIPDFGRKAMPIAQEATK